MPKGESKPPKKTFFLKIHAHPPLDILGHADGLFQDLRSALDYLIWGLSQLDSACTPPDNAAFPIFLDSKRYKKEGIPKIRCVPNEAKSIIEELQPYNRGKNVDPLWVLLHMADVNKHRDLSLVETGIRIRFPSFDDKLAYLLSGNFHDGDEIAIEASDIIYRDTKVDFKVDPVFSIVVQKGAFKVHLSVDGINPIYDYVRDKVIARFEKFFP